MCSFGCASCDRISSATIPPATKKSRLVRMYRIPIRLWSTVASQPEYRPRATIVAAGAGVTLTATRVPSETLDVGEQRVHLAVGPATADRRHLPAAVPKQRLDRALLAEDRVAPEIRPEAALSLEAMARRADALERVPPEVRGAA